LWLACTISARKLIDGMYSSHRVVSIHPNQFLGCVGEHGPFPIEKLACSHDQTYLASCSHDESIKFWNVVDFYASDDEEEKEDTIVDASGMVESTADTAMMSVGQVDSSACESEEEQEKARKPKRAKHAGDKMKPQSSFFADLEDF
jgi:WD40 repeat protein